MDFSNPRDVEQRRLELQTDIVAARANSSEKSEPTEKGLVEVVKGQPQTQEAIEHLTDLGNARRMAKRHGNDLRYCYPWKKWLVWSGKHWQIDDTGAVLRLARDTIASIYGEAATVSSGKEIAKHAMDSESDARVRAMVSLLQSEPGIAILPNQLDSDPWLLNVLNGSINLKTGKLRDHCREDFCMKLAPVSFEPKAKATKWNAFLKRIMNEKKSLVKFLQRAVGYALTGKTLEQVLFILYGAGSNGKSTFLDAISAMLGPYAKQAPFDTFLARKGERIPNDLAGLVGMRFVTAVEAEKGKRLSEATIKQITGGDKVSARFLFGEWFEFYPAFKLFLSCNDKPIIRGRDHAIWRRPKLIPFNVVIPDGQQDKELGEKLRLEASGILNWSIKGCLEWQRSGLEVPEEVTHATESYREEMDVLVDFLDEKCSIASDLKIKATDLFKFYCDWCKENSESPLPRREFVSSLEQRGLTRNKGTAGIFYWYGIGRRDDQSGLSGASGLKNNIIPLDASSRGKNPKNGSTPSTDSTLPGMGNSQDKI